MRSLKWILASSLVAVLAACTPGGGGGADTTKPTISLAASSSSVTTASNLTLTATASDNVGVTRVEFFDGSNLVGTDTTAGDGFSAVVALTSSDNGNKSYTARASDAAGNQETSSARAVTVNIAGADTTAPTLASSTPVNNATGVAIGANLVFTFSEAMNQGTVGITLNPSHDVGEPTWSADGRTATYDPATDLTPTTAYSVAIAGQDLAGNALAATSVSFTTATPPDTTAPTVESVTPANASVNVPVSTNIQFSFSEPMNRTTVEAAFTSTPAVTCIWGWSSDSRLASCDPSANFAASTNVTIGLGTGAQDAAGNPLASAFSASFTTAAAPDTTAPSLTSSNPTDSTQGVERNANIVLTFSEPMDKISVQSSFNVSNPAGVTGAWSWNAAGTVGTFNPNSDFAYNQVVNWSLSNAARDLANNPLPATISRSFRTLRQFTVRINSTATLDGWVSSNNEVLTAPAFIIPDGIVGDFDNNNVYRTFLSFDLTALPSNLRRITAASLYVRQASMSGNPYSTIANLIAERVNYGTSLDASDYGLPVLNISGILTQRTLSTTTTNGYKSTIITSNTTEAWDNRAANGSRIQWRLRFGAFSGGSNFSNNGISDFITVGSGNSSDEFKPYIEVNYEAP